MPVHRSRICAFAAVALLLAACATPSCAQSSSPRASPSPRRATSFSARITGANAGINNTRAYGTANIQILDNNRAVLTFEIDRISDLTVAQIRVAPPRQNGPTIATVYQPTNYGASQPISGTFKTARNSPIPLNPSVNNLYNSLLAGNAYINFNTKAFPNGEVRGNFVAN